MTATPKQFQRASKKKAKLRLAIYGPSGSGKTFTSLRIAKGFGMLAAVIDTEDPLNGGSASKYADRFDFDVLTLPNPTIEEMTEALEAAAGQGYEFVVIDSLSHVWQQLLEEVDAIAKHSKGNSWSAWSEGTPKQRKFIRTLISYPGHVVATMRAKTEWVTEKDERTGKSKPVRVGLAPEQGKSIEYEFDLLVSMTTENYAHIEKDRTGRFQDRILHKPDEDFAKSILDWLNSGVDDLAPEQDVENIRGYMHILPKERQDYVTMLLSRGIGPALAKEVLEEIRFERRRQIAAERKVAAAAPAPAPAQAPYPDPAKLNQPAIPRMGREGAQVRNAPAAAAVTAAPIPPGSAEPDPFQQAELIAAAADLEADMKADAGRKTLFDDNGNLNDGGDNDLPF